jgi:hypothetical protein
MLISKRRSKTLQSRCATFKLVTRKGLMVSIRDSSFPTGLRWAEWDTVRSYMHGQRWERDGSKRRVCNVQ